MNAPKEYYESKMRPALEPTEYFIGVLLKGKVQTYAACDTLQVKDYSKYSMGMFDESKKKDVHETQFPADLEGCFNLGKELSQ